jgi:hypothetical protein
MAEEYPGGGVKRDIDNDTFAKAMRAKRAHGAVVAERIAEGAILIHHVGEHHELGVWPTTMGGGKITLGKRGDDGYEQEWMYQDVAMAAYEGGGFAAAIMEAHEKSKPWPDHPSGSWLRWRHVDGREERRPPPPAPPTDSKCGQCGKTGAMEYGVEHPETGERWMACSQSCWGAMVARTPVLQEAEGNGSFPTTSVKRVTDPEEIGMGPKSKAKVDALRESAGFTRRPDETDYEFRKRLVRQVSGTE